MILGVAAALVAATCYGFGSILQAMAAADSTVTARLDAVLLARLLAQWRYVSGLSLDLVGFLAAVVALRTLPLFVVQAAVASSIGVTAIAARQLLHARFDVREQRALVGLVVGLALLGIAGRPEHATRLAEPGPLLLLGSAAVLAALVVTFTRSTSERAGVLLAAGAGVAFGVVGIASRALSVPSPAVHVLGDPLLWAILAHGGLATVLYAAALQRGRVTTVAAITFSVETVAPAAFGIAFLGDHARAGLAPVAVVGFALTVGASILLARFAEPVVPAELTAGDR